DVHAAALGRALDRALAVDRLAQRVDHPAQQALAHRHVHDLAQAADLVALGDRAVLAEDHDAHVVALEVERHALHPGLGELDHLAGLDVVEAEHAGDAVADGEHLADVGNVRLLAEVGDLRLQDGRNLGGADIHGSYALLRANFRESSFDFSEASNRREPTCTLMPPRMAGSTRVSISGSLPSAWRSAAATPFDWAAVSGRAVVTWAETAPRALADMAWKAVMVAGSAAARPLAARRPRNLRVVALNLALAAMAVSAAPLSSDENFGEPTSVRRSRLSARAV